MLDLTNTSIAIYVGPLEESAIRSALVEARATTALSLEVEVSSDNLGTLPQMVEGMGFRVSGTVVKANGMFVRFSKKVQHTDGVALSYNPGLAIPKLSPSPEEIQAVEYVMRKVRVPDDVEEQAQRIKDEAMKTFHPEIESPEFSMAPYRYLQKENDAQIAALQAEIRSMQSKPEGQ